MKHLIEIYNIEADELLEELEVPATRKKELFKLMGWQNAEDDIYVYDLTPQQLQVIEEWMGRKIGGPGLIVQLAGEAD